MSEDYGDAVVEQRGSRLVVSRADDVIGFSLEFFPTAGMTVDANGCLLLAGDPRHRYRPVRFVPSMAGGPPTVLVCERVPGPGEGVR